MPPGNAPRSSGDAIGLLWLVDDDPDQRRRFDLSYRTAEVVAPHLPKAVATIGRQESGTGADIHLRTARRGHAAKVDAMAATPFATTLWLDNDTVLLRDPTPVLLDTDYVAAVPYPDFFDARRLGLAATGLPPRWRNVQSGVVSFSRRFVEHYVELWDQVGADVGRLPGYDQCIFSLALATAPEPWTPRLDLQVTTSAYAVQFLATARGVPTGEGETPWLGDVPMTLLLGTFVFHYTAFKDWYELRLRDLGLASQLTSRWVRDPEWLDSFGYPELDVDPTAVPPPPRPGGPSSRGVGS